MRTESGLTRYWLEARRSWGPTLMEAEWTRRQFLAQDTPRLTNNTRPAIMRRMALGDHVITWITMTNILTRHGGVGQGSTELEFRLSKILEG